MFEEFKGENLPIIFPFMIGWLGLGFAILRKWYEDVGWAAVITAVIVAGMATVAVFSFRVFSIGEFILWATIAFSIGGLFFFLGKVDINIKRKGGRK